MEEKNKISSDFLSYFAKDFFDDDDDSYAHIFESFNVRFDEIDNLVMKAIALNIVCVTNAIRDAYDHIAPFYPGIHDFIYDYCMRRFKDIFIMTNEIIHLLSRISDDLDLPFSADTKEFGDMPLSD